MDSKEKVKGPTGFVTEPRMAEHRCLWDDKYPECPQRLIGVIERQQSTSKYTDQMVNSVKDVADVVMQARKLGT